MFFEYMYLDMPKIRQFASYMGISFDEVLTGKKRTDAIGTNVNFGIVEANVSLKREREIAVSQSDISIFTTFKDKLEKEKTSFVNDGDYSDHSYISQLERGKILKFDGQLGSAE